MSMETSQQTTLPLERPGLFKRAVTHCMLVVFTITTVAPSAPAFANGPGFFAALQAYGGTGDAAALPDEARYARFFQRAREEIAAIAGKPDENGRLPDVARQESATTNLDDLLDDLDDIQSSIEDGFDDVGKLVRTKKLPKSIRARQDAAVAAVTGEFEAMRRDMRQVRTERDSKKRRSLAEGLYRRLDVSRFERQPQEVKPFELPNSTLKPDMNIAPRLTEDAFIASGLVGNPIYRVAQAGGYNIARLPGASDPAFLAANDEVVLTYDIRAKAAELGNEPVRIFEWVRNTVQWAPTWGAIQDASHTLSARKGNAFDISSLTIALLRAAGYPARYVHGTIDVPEDAFRNWMGGFQNINAAMEFASSGGIPLGPVTSAGKITKVRMEHIWVEAAIDFLPSRGAKNREADTWVAIDPSFKQIDIRPGIDVRQVAGVDTQAVASTFLGTGMANVAEGWVAGADPTALLNAQTQARVALRSHVAQNLPNGTAVQVLGANLIVAAAFKSLPSGLPNKVVTVGARYGALPTALQQRITFAFGKDIEGEPVNPRTFAWAPLNNHEVILSFRPATADDVAAVLALLPQGDLTSPSDVPRNIPAYLINVVPELKVDRTVVMTGAPVTLGTEINFVFNPQFAGRGSKAFSYRIQAGAYLAVSVVGGTVSPAALERSSAALQSQRAAFGDPTQSRYDGMTRDDVLGTLYHSAVLSYYSQYALLTDAAGQSTRSFLNLAAGLGSAGYEPFVQSFFGVPRTMRTGVFALNIPIVNIVGADSSTDAARRNSSLQNGLISSALEHTVVEDIVSGDQQRAEAISAVKAIELARKAGGRIYEVTAANLSTALAATSLDPAARAEIQGAINNGRVAVVHSGSVSVTKWSGSGYIIFDPATGEGAYKITGGANGGAAGLDEDTVTNSLSVMAAGLMGWVDGFAQRLLKQPVMLLSEVKYGEKLERISTRVGIFALLVALYAIGVDDEKPLDEKIMTASIELLAFAVSSYITSAIASVGFLAANPIFWSVLAAILVSIIVIAIEDALTSAIWPDGRQRQRLRQRWV
jgi:hypothetical protein